MEFREVDVSQDREAAREVMRRTGQLGVPVIKSNDRLLSVVTVRRNGERLTLILPA